MLGWGSVQEEIRFSVCPELLVSLVFMECMDDNEAIVISGFEQFAKYKGYARSLRFAGNHRDNTQVNPVSGQLLTRTIPHRAGTGPHEWFHWLVVLLVGSCPSGELS